MLEPKTTMLDTPMRYIQRLDVGHHSWKVALRRKGKHHHAYFTDSVYGGTAQALAAAIAWRDQLLAKISGVDYGVWRRERMQPTNTSGIVGVYRGINFKTKGGRKYKFALWCGYWQNANGKRSARSFSVSKYGEEQAKALAIQARQDGMADVRRQLRGKIVHKGAKS